MRCQTEKFTSQGHEVEVVKLRSGQHLVRRCFAGRNDWDEEYDYVGEELSIEEDIFDHAPTQKLEAIVVGLRKQIKNLQHERATLAQEIRDVEKAGKEKLAKYKKYDQLKTLDMFLDGKITHYVHERYGTIRIITSDRAKCDCRDDEMKLLTLFGRSNGNVEWNLNDYSDGSGSHFTVIPCLSYTEAHRAAQNIVNDKMKKNYTDVDVIRSAKKYDLKIDPEYVRKYEEKEQAKKEKEIRELEGMLAKLREGDTK